MKQKTSMAGVGYSEVVDTTRPANLQYIRCLLLIKRFQEHDPAVYKESLYMLGDATDEDALTNAGVECARGVIASRSVGTKTTLL